MNSSRFVRIEVEPHTAGEIDSVVNRIATEERACTNSQIVHAILLYRATQIGNRICGEALSDVNGISAREDNEFVSSQLRFSHRVQLSRIGSRVSDAQSGEHHFHRFNIRRSPGSVETKDRLAGVYHRRQRGRSLGASRCTCAEQNRSNEERRQQDQARPAIDEGMAKEHKKPLEVALPVMPPLCGKVKKRT